MPHMLLRDDEKHHKPQPSSFPQLTFAPAPRTGWPIGCQGPANCES